MTERPYHHGNLRTALLAQAEQTVRERGVEELSLRELAREVGVSHGAPRRHFPDRQALLDALAEAGFARLGTELRSAVDGAGEELRGAAAGDRRGLRPLRHARRGAARADVRRQAPGQTGALHEAADRAFSVMLELIEQGQAERRARARRARARRSRPVRDDPGHRRAGHRRHGRRRADRRARRRRDRAFPARLARAGLAADVSGRCFRPLILRGFSCGC